ncbi:hypothetical protein BJ508DRAFT_363877 [Ascobolus immersus RN42]|uniref:Uncharacterized protein n=1 Tax=Ascobolus immersus RN42 TaxID=1160509 RepID=A0A3N4I0T3_ASCIM|nr:hypothetical protein BJ508DRAFT_363877 [Ascobolus immersus RN42]
MPVPGSLETETHTPVTSNSESPVSPLLSTTPSAVTTLDSEISRPLELVEALGEDNDATRSSEDLILPVDVAEDPTCQFHRSHTDRACFDYTDQIELVAQAVLDFRVRLSVYKEVRMARKPRNLMVRLKQYKLYIELVQLQIFIIFWILELTVLTATPERLHAVDLIRFQEFQRLGKDIRILLLLSELPVQTRSPKHVLLGRAEMRELFEASSELSSPPDFEEILIRLKTARMRLNEKIIENKAAIESHAILIDPSTTSVDSISALREMDETSESSLSTPTLRHDPIELAADTNFPHSLLASEVYKKMWRRISTSSLRTVDSISSSARRSLSLISMTTKHSDSDDASISAFAGYMPTSMLLAELRSLRASLISSIVEGNAYNLVQSFGDSLQINGNINGPVTFNFMITQVVTGTRNQQADEGINEHARNGTETGVVAREVMREQRDTNEMEEGSEPEMSEEGLRQLMREVIELIRASQR